MASSQSVRNGSLCPRNCASAIVLQMSGSHILVVEAGSGVGANG